MTSTDVIRPMPLKRSTVSRKQINSDAERRDTYDAINPLDVAMMYRFKAMGPEKARAYLKRCEEVAAARERKGLEEKVNSWRESLTSLTNIDPD